MFKEKTGVLLKILKCFDVAAVAPKEARELRYDWTDGDRHFKYTVSP